MVLSGKQKEELNKSICDYLQQNGYPQTLAMFQVRKIKFDILGDLGSWVLIHSWASKNKIVKT